MGQNGSGKATEIRSVDLDAIRDGELVAVIVRDDATPEGYRMAGYCDGRAVPESAEAAAAGRSVLVPCLCGAVGLVYRGYSHHLPEVHRWPTLNYLCPTCGAALSFLRLSAADARRALKGGLGLAARDGS